MHGCGNDFVVVFASANEAPPATPVIRELADRRTGIGFDQLLWVEPSDTATVAYRIFNADGGEVGQCGNGVRCIALAAADRLSTGSELTLKSPAGVIEARILGPAEVSVSMGRPELTPADIPFIPLADDDQAGDRRAVNTTAGQLQLTPVSMGNPHAVIRVDSVDSAPLETLGPELQTHAQFPDRANVGFLEVLDRANARLRVFERGVGETAACGTGACAAMVAGRLADWFDETVTLSLPGGSLMVNWKASDSSVWLTGPAEYAFTGNLSL